jgi:hypothetical protein
MRKLVFKSAIVATLFVGVLYATPAQAQATRTWVSGVGDDANPCSRTAPCKTFAGAISKTATNGEINVLDPGGFGAVTITKAITISADSVEAGVLTSVNSGILINAPAGADVTIRGLDIEGLGTASFGVRLISASKVTIDKCVIHNFVTSGVEIAGPAGARVVVKDSIITKNATGVNIVGNGGGSNVGIVLNSTLDARTAQAVNVASGSTLFLGGSRLFGSLASVTNAGTFNSFGDNALQGTGTPTTTIALR